MSRLLGVDVVLGNRETLRIFVHENQLHKLDTLQEEGNLEFSAHSARSFSSITDFHRGYWVRRGEDGKPEE